MMMNRLITSGSAASVFISSSTEVRKGLPDYLRARLRMAGMRVFKDVDDFPKGVNLRDASRWAIDSSGFSVVILSRGFVSSVSRLDELVQIREKELMMMKSSNSGSDPLYHSRCFPIFYRVSPDECSRLLVGSGAGSCFHDGIERHGTQPTYRKLTWIDALAWLGGIAGWVLTDDRPEAEVVEQVVTTIQERIRGSLFTGHHHHDPYPIWEQQGNPPPAAASAIITASASSAATVPFRTLILAAASAFSGAAAAVAIFICATAAHLGAS